MYRNTFVEINIDNLQENVKNIKNYFNNYKYYFGVVKGNAYGHDIHIINYLIESGINYLAVSSLEEAIKLRKVNNEIPVLCLEPIDLDYIDICIKNNITITIHDYDYYKGLMNKKLEGKLKVHIKIDSGMNRIGIKDRDHITEIYNNLINSKNIILEGIYTHLATTGISDIYWDKQVKKFKYLTENIDLNKIPIVHMARSIAFLDHPKIDICNGIRIGIAMYGYDPNPIQRNDLKSKLRAIKAKMRIKKYKISPTINKAPIELKPAFSLCSEIIQVKDVKKGEFVGYGAGYIATEDIVVGTIPIGYDDGIFRKSRGRYVVINNKRYTLIGDIGMGMISVKIDKTVKLHDRVTLIGEGISLKEVSTHNGTTIYESMCNIKNTVPRVFKKENKIIKIQEY